MVYERWSVIKRLLVCLGIYAAFGLVALLERAAGVGLTVVLGLIFLANSLFLYYAILAPLRQMNRQYLHFNQGYDSHSIFRRALHYSEGEERALQKIHAMLNNQEVNRLSNRQAQYLALQNQINPHFLYNTLEAIRGDALSEGMVNIANITEALATFFRYTISNMDNLVSLDEELSNAENYFAIQNYRFGERIGMLVEIEKGSENARDFQIPKLTLQPIIENAIIHGLEYQVGPGLVKVNVSTDGARLQIEVTDDGVGMSEKVLDEINRHLLHPEAIGRDEDKARSGHIALVNVNNRIRLLFGEQYGLRVSSIKGVGTRVAINLPVRLATDR